MGLHPPVRLRMRRVRRRPPMMFGPGRVSRWPRTRLGRCRVGRCRRSSAEMPKVGPHRPVTSRRGSRLPRSRPSDSRSARIVRRQLTTRGREGKGPSTPPMSRVRAPFHQLSTSGHGRTGLWPRAAGILSMSVRMRNGRRHLPVLNQGPSGGHPRRWRVGSGQIRQVWRQGRSGRPNRAPPHRHRSHRRRFRQRRSHGRRSRRRPSRRDRTSRLGVGTLRPHPVELWNLSIVPCRRRRFGLIRGVAGTCRGAGRAVRLGRPTHRGTDPHRRTSPPPHAPGSRPPGRRETVAEHHHHGPVKVPHR
jgi:hypothetical protein